MTESFQNNRAYEIAFVPEFETKSLSRLLQDLESYSIGRSDLLIYDNTPTAVRELTQAMVYWTHSFSAASPSHPATLRSAVS